MPAVISALKPWPVPAAMPASWRPWWDSFCRFLLAEDASLRTLDTYGHSISQLAVFCAERGRRGPAEVETGDIQDFMRQLLAEKAPATAHNRFRAIRRYYNWLVEEGEVERSPMGRLKAPRVPETPPDVLTDDQLRRLLKACEGRDFKSRRDTALLRFMIDTGVRREGVVTIRLDGLRLDQGEADIIAKGGDTYIAFFGRKVARDLDRYLRVRGEHRFADSPMLWIGHRGDVTTDGLNQIFRGRARQAGIIGFHPHLLRHTFAHLWKAAGGTEEDLMTAGGWKDARSMRRYGRSAAIARARAAHSRLSPGDRI